AVEERYKLTDDEIKACRAEALKFLNSKDYVAQFAGLRALKSVGDASCVKPLMIILKDKNQWIRKLAMENLELYADDSCVAGMVTAIKGKGRDSAHLETDPYFI